MIELAALTKNYGTFTAVDHVDLVVPRGDLFGFLGPNGAGKTTTLRMIAGILRPTAGTVRIAGVDVTADPTAAKRVLGFIPDRPFIYEKLTGAESCDLSRACSARAARRSRRERVSCWRCSISRTGATSWSRATATGCDRS